MEVPVETVTENNLPVNTEVSNSAQDGVVTDKSEETLQPLVNGATCDGSASAVGTCAKADDETKCKINDDVNYEWTDITGDFIGACSSLELGELVHDSKYVTKLSATCFTF